MTAWNESDLVALGDADEVHVASRRRDGDLSKHITIWGVRVGDHFYVRSAYGPDNGWFRRALAAGRGGIRGGGSDVDVTFTHVNSADPINADLDAVYREKYGRYAKNIVDTVVGPEAAEVTFRLDPEG
ncbi:DUF2255 family protein [Agromyces sp. LHK192]|uniref:DUF2255 family protein n=1 Tax=Agromyces sp. LHK192 TaxID=2498704 RepID=UPI000FD7D966|nr:DUF2255 family protein [Agromyces sp. LHK192]